MTREILARSGLTTPTLTRRLFVLLGLTGLVGAAGRLARVSMSMGSIYRSEAALLAGVRTDSALVVGKLVLAALPNIGTRDQLVQALFDDLRLDGHQASPALRFHLGAKIAERVRLDFAAGNIVDVAGWRFSLTEARLCALAVRCTSGAK